MDGIATVTWYGIEGHDRIVERFRRAISAGRIGGTYLFVGPPGIGKKTFALKLAQVLLCEKRPEREFAACHACSACLQVMAGTHPDLLLISKPADKAFIPLELLIGSREARGTEQAGLIGHLALTPYSGRYRVAIIDDADYLNPEGANALLKTLEEPPPAAVLILIGTSPAKQLPTIRSRSQLIRFRPLSPDVAASILVQQGTVTDFEWAKQLVRLADGSLTRAQELVAPELWELFARWKAALADRTFDVLSWSEAIRGFMESSAKEVAVRRRTLQLFIGLTIEFFRQALSYLTEAEENPADKLAEGDPAVLTLVANSPRLDPDVIIRCIEDSLSAHEHVERNVNPTLVIEDWLLGLWRVLNGVLV